MSSRIGPRKLLAKGKAMNELSTNIEHGPSYEEFIDQMERARIAYQRGHDLFHDGIPDFALTNREKFVKDPATRLGFRYAAKNIKLRYLDKQGPMPIDLRAYIIAKQYNPEKRTFRKLIAKLIKHKASLHPYVRRFLIERMRKDEQQYLELARAYADIAAQFEDAPAAPNNTPEAA
jgi:hypothetical protein